MSDYEVKIEVEDMPDRVFLAVTHNGYQWSCIRIDDPQFEIPKIISVLRHFLDEMAYVKAKEPPSDDERRSMLKKRLIGRCDHFLIGWPNARYGPAHIVLDDNNLTRDDVAWCLALTDAAVKRKTSDLSSDDAMLLRALGFYSNHSKEELMATKEFLSALLEKVE